jgi:hypothetical protein
MTKKTPHNPNEAARNRHYVLNTKKYLNQIGLIEDGDEDHFINNGVVDAIENLVNKEAQKYQTKPSFGKKLKSGFLNVVDKAGIPLAVGATLGGLVSIAMGDSPDTFQYAVEGAKEGTLYAAFYVGVAQAGSYLKRLLSKSVSTEIGSLVKDELDKDEMGQEIKATFEYSMIPKEKARSDILTKISTYNLNGLLGCVNGCRAIVISTTSPIKGGITGLIAGLGYDVAFTQDPSLLMMAGIGATSAVLKDGKKMFDDKREWEKDIAQYRPILENMEDDDLQKLVGVLAKKWYVDDLENNGEVIDLIMNRDYDLI